MVRNSSYLTALMAALTTLVAVLAHSQPLPAPPSAIAPQIIDNQRDRATVPICYIQFQNGQLRDLRRLCGRTASPLPVRRTQNNTQRPNVQSRPDAEDEEGVAPAASPAPRATPPQVIPGASSTPQPTPQPTLTQPSWQPANSPNTGPNTGIGAPDRPISTPLPSANPSPTLSSTPPPVALPADDSR